jgi:hypothetical protein
MAEVKRVPQWVMLEALRNKVNDMWIEKSDGTYVGVSGVAPEDFTVSTQDYEPVLKLSIPKTLEVGVGDTIMAILLMIDDTNAPAEYDAVDDSEIRYPIVDVDGNGETFPDGGSIDVTDFEVYLNDL